jgi:bifunctional non-homologous end joining protein LigD
MASDTGTIKVGSRSIEVSNLDKVFYPDAGFTKGDVIDYYRAVAPVLVPHLKGRPITLKRYPNGVNGPFFYEKECPSHRPSWIKTAAITRRQDGKAVNYCVLNDEASLVWAANLADLELHTSLAVGRNVERPQTMVFDLDPGPPAGLAECCEVALVLRAMLDSAKLEGFAKTSGSKGLQVFVPLRTSTTYEDTKAFAQAFARILEDERPDEVISKPSRAERKGKVFVDWSQNDRHKTTVSVYSLRARPRPTVSTPVTWDEVAAAAEARDQDMLVFEHNETLARIEEHGDLFEPVLTTKQRLPKI